MQWEVLGGISHTLLIRGIWQAWMKGMFGGLKLVCEGVISRKWQVSRCRWIMYVIIREKSLKRSMNLGSCAARRRGMSIEQTMRGFIFYTWKRRGCR